MQHSHSETSTALGSEPVVSSEAAAPTMPTYSRPLSDNEQSYFLQSRTTGANDMIMEIEFKAPSVLITLDRMALAWAILRVQHPMLASRVEMERGNYHSCRWVYTPPSSAQAALLAARPSIHFQWQTPHDPSASPTSSSSPSSFNPSERLLSPTTQSCLILLAPPGSIAPVRSYRLLINYAHYHIDGIAAHMLAHALFALLGGSGVTGQPPRSDEDLRALLEVEWRKRWGGVANGVGEVVGNVIPQHAEARLPQLKGKWQVVAAKVENAAQQKRIVGGHAFPRKPAPSTKNVNRMKQYTRAETKTILAACRANRVTFSNALYALCNIAWIRIVREQPGYDPRQPVMMYSAVSLRHLFTAPETMPVAEVPVPNNSNVHPPSFIFLAVSYFNAVLPGFLPPPERMSEARIMWHRARSARDQLRRYLRSPMLIPRVHTMVVERGERARRFAKEDDEALLKAQLKLCVPGMTLPAVEEPSKPAAFTSKPPPSIPTSLVTPPPARSPPPLPSIPLIGLSQTGNLDHIYDTRLYPSIDIEYLHCHTRKNKGGMLLFGHTFRGRLALQFSWDEAGFAPGVVEAFWEALDVCVRELMIEPAGNGNEGGKMKGKL